MGSIYKRGNTLWIKYYRNGVAMRESAGTDKEQIAKRLLQKREGDIAHGIPVTPQTDRVTVGELLDDVLNDYRVNNRKSIKTQTIYIEHHVRPYFGKRKAAAVTVTDVRAYVVHRQSETGKNKKKPANATINRELAALRRAYSLGHEAGLITHVPKIDPLKENNARSGYFERDQYERVRGLVTDPIKPVVAFLYVTGWRVGSEVLPLQWRHVDFEGGVVRLDPGTTKNGEARTFPMTTELRRLLEWQRAHTDAVQREHGRIIPWVFHRDGERIKGFRRSWKTACKKAGVPGRIRHDFRRTSVRNLVRAGVAERVAMELTGHRTRAIFDRYHIVNEGDLFDAAAKLEKLAGTISGTIAEEPPARQRAGARK